VINSNLGRISYRFRDVASFLLKTHFPTPSSNPKFENVSLTLHHPNFAPTEPRHQVNYSCKSFSFTT